MTPVYPPGSLQAGLEDALRELIPEAAAEHAALEDANELRDLETLINLYRPADEQTLVKLFRGRREVGDLKADYDLFVHLPLVRITRTVMFPVLSFAYNWPKQVLRLRVGLFYRSPDGSGSSDLRAFGVRFETPECWADDPDEPTDDPEALAGHHDMFHAQPIRELCRGDSSTALPGLDWLDSTQPSIPVSAKDIRGLVVVMLVSIYGRKQIRERYQARKLQSLRTAAEQVSGLPDPPERART